MQIHSIYGVRIAKITYELGEKAVDNPSPSKDVIGFNKLRRAEESTTSAALQIAAAKKLEADFSDYGALVSVSFTQHSRMPNNSAQIAAALDFPKDALTLDIMAACSGYGYALYIAALFVTSTGRKVLLLDGDKQSEFMNPKDEATNAVLADGATATILEPSLEGKVWNFYFESDSAKSAALKLEKDGHIEMDGYQVFRYVASDVAKAIKGFMATIEVTADSFDYFLPHQANLFMVRQLAKGLGFSGEKVVLNTSEVGNLASASIPFAMSSRDLRDKRCLVSGFGGGLSLFVADLTL